MDEKRILSDDELDMASGGVSVRRAAKNGLGLKCPFCKQSAMKPSGDGKTFVCESCGFSCGREQLEI